jgi:hypothetical protein
LERDLEGGVTIERNDRDVRAEIRFDTVLVGWDACFLQRWTGLLKSWRVTTDDGSNDGDNVATHARPSPGAKPKTQGGGDVKATEKQQFSKIELGLQMAKVIWNFDFGDNLEADDLQRFLEETGAAYRNENLRLEIDDIEMSSSCVLSNGGDPSSDTASEDTGSHKLDTWKLEFKQANAFLVAPATTVANADIAFPEKPFARIRLLKRQASRCVIKLQDTNQSQSKRHQNGGGARILQDGNGALHLEHTHGAANREESTAAPEDTYEFEKAHSSEQENQSSAESAREEMLLAETESIAERSSAVSVRLLLPHVTVNIDEDDYSIALHLWRFVTKTKQISVPTSTPERGSSSDIDDVDDAGIAPPGPKSSGPSFFVSLEMDESELVLRERTRGVLPLDVVDGAPDNTSKGKTFPIPASEFEHEAPSEKEGGAKTFVLAMERAKVCHFHGVRQAQKFAHNRFACKDFTLYEQEQSGVCQGCNDAGTDDGDSQALNEDSSDDGSPLVPILMLTKWGTTLDFVLPQNRYAFSILYKTEDGQRDLSASLHSLTLRFRVFSDWFPRIRKFLAGSSRATPQEDEHAGDSDFKTEPLPAPRVSPPPPITSVLRIRVMMYDSILDYMADESQSMTTASAAAAAATLDGDATPEQHHVVIKIGAVNVMSNIVPQSTVENYKVALQDLELFIANKNLSRDDDARLLVHIEPGYNATFIASEDAYRPASSLKARLKAPIRVREGSSKKTFRRETHHASGGSTVGIIGMGRVQGKQLQVQEYLEQEGFVTTGTLDYFDLYHTQRRLLNHAGMRVHVEPGTPISDFEMFIGTMSIYTCADSLFFMTSAVSCLTFQVAQLRNPRKSVACPETADAGTGSQEAVEMLPSKHDAFSPMVAAGLNRNQEQTRLHNQNQMGHLPGGTSLEAASSSSHAGGGPTSTTATTTTTTTGTTELDPASIKPDDELSGSELRTRYAKKVTFEQPAIIEDRYFQSKDLAPQQDLGVKQATLGQSFMERSQYAVYYPQKADDSDSGSEQNSDDFEAMSDSDNDEEPQPVTDVPVPSADVSVEEASVGNQHVPDVENATSPLPLAAASEAVAQVQMQAQGTASTTEGGSRVSEGSFLSQGSIDDDDEDSPMTQSMWALSSHHTLGLSFLHKEPEEFEMSDMSKSITSRFHHQNDAMSTSTSSSDGRPSTGGSVAMATAEAVSNQDDGNDPAPSSMSESLVLPIAPLDDATQCEVQLEIGGDLQSNLMQRLKGERDPQDNSSEVSSMPL